MGWWQIANYDDLYYRNHVVIVRNERRRYDPILWIPLWLLQT